MGHVCEGQERARAGPRLRTAHILQPWHPLLWVGFLLRCRLRTDVTVPLYTPVQATAGMGRNNENFHLYYVAWGFLIPFFL